MLRRFIADLARRAKTEARPTHARESNHCPRVGMPPSSTSLDKARTNTRARTKNVSINTGAYNENANKTRTTQSHRNSANNSNSCINTNT